MAVRMGTFIKPDQIKLMTPGFPSPELLLADNAPSRNRHQTPDTTPIELAICHELNINKSR